MSTIALAQRDADLLAALRRLEGRGTLADVAAAAGLPSEDVRAGLKRLLESHRGHLEVAETGELLYSFDPRLIARGTEPWMVRARRAAGRAFRGAFKAAITVVLVGYFALFVALVIAALVAGNKDRDGGSWGGRRGGRGHGHTHFGFGDFWLWYWLFGRNWGYGRPYYGRRWEAELPRGVKVPFYKKVFAFVFGPDEPQPTREQRDRSIIRLIRARGGVLTTAELVEHTGATFAEAEEEMGRLMGAYDGDAVPSPDGEVVYVFEQLMPTLHDRDVREPRPAWRRLEPRKELTGNTAATNLLVGGMNAFTLAASATAPWFIFPRLGIGGTLAVLGLVVVPATFSTLFFAVPGLRAWRVARENRRRRRRNVRKVLLGLVYARTLAEGGEVGEAEARAHVLQRLPEASPQDVERALHELAAELDADVRVGDDGETWYRFDALRRAFTASEAMRRALKLERRTLGEIVYSTADDAAAESRRAAELFDRALSAGEPELARYVPAPERIDFEEDFEVIMPETLALAGAR